MQSVQCSRHPPEDLEWERTLVEAEAQVGGKVSDERSVERVALGFAVETCMRATQECRKSRSQIAEGAGRQSCSASSKGANVSTATGESVRPSSASASDACASWTSGSVNCSRSASTGKFPHVWFDERTALSAARAAAR